MPSSADPAQPEPIPHGPDLDKALLDLAGATVEAIERRLRGGATPDAVVTAVLSAVLDPGRVNEVAAAVLEILA